MTQVVLTVLGDSIGAGATADDPWLENSFVYQFAAFYHNGAVTVKNHAVGGAKVADGMAAQVPAAASDDADIILVELGTNGNGTADPVGVYQQGLVDLYTTNPRARVYCMSAFSGVPDNASMQQGAANAAAAGVPVTWVDTSTWLTPADLADGLHPNQVGHTKLASNLLTIVSSRDNVATLLLQPDATAGIDTYLRGGIFADTVFGTADSISFGRWDTEADYDMRALLRFDLTPLAGATITSAALYLYDVAGANGNWPATYEVHRVLAANSGWSESSTWNYKVPSTTRWAGDAGGNGGTDAGCSQIGTDYAAAVMGSLAFSGYAEGAERVIVLDTAEFAEMVAANYGLVLVMSDSDWESWGVASSDHATASWHPKLVVDYSIPAPANNVTPIWVMRRCRR